MRALDHTKQKHVSNFIRDNGNRTDEYGDDGPLHSCRPTEWGRLFPGHSKIFDLIDIRNGLLNEMFSADCFNTQQLHYIEGEAEWLQRVRLLEMVRAREVLLLTTRLFNVSNKQSSTKLCMCWSQVWL